jgi:glycosyltransferase involved in cell wall biosynthesis
MSGILFSVIVPTYNREDFIVKTIQSVLSQAYSNFELLIIDDGSTDNTERVV